MTPPNHALERTAAQARCFFQALVGGGRSAPGR